MNEIKEIKKELQLLKEDVYEYCDKIAEELEKARNMNVELMKVNERQSLVAKIRDGKIHEYVVCSYFDATKEDGSQWCWGHYFEKLESAMNYVAQCQDKLPRPRLEELATLFKDGLIKDDKDSAMEYFEDICEMTEEEKEFFGIE